MEQHTRPRGVFPMPYAFFDERGALYRRASGQQVEAVVASGAHGIAVLGLVTEVGAVSPTERRTLVEWAGEGCRRPGAAHGDDRRSRRQRNGYTAARRRSRGHSDARGPAAAWGDRRRNELPDFFASVMRATPLPTGIQKGPEYLGVRLSPDAVRTLAVVRGNFVLMKAEGAVAVVKAVFDVVSRDLAIFTGPVRIEDGDRYRSL